jgi:V/A-type H+-transporting ATPase subunit D
LREALLDIGSEALDRASLGVRSGQEAEVGSELLMGLHLPHARTQAREPGTPFGITGTSANADRAMLLFVEVLGLLPELAECQTAIIRLARELRRTQRRCNALSKLLIPAHHETITYITSSLEERERESFTILKMIRDRYRASER